jgi:hypothetical protein
MTLRHESREAKSDIKNGGRDFYLGTEENEGFKGIKYWVFKISASIPGEEQLKCRPSSLVFV